MSWRVTRQAADQIKNDPSGATVTGTVVSFVTGLNQNGNVFIEDALYGDAATVKAAIDAKAAVVDQVAQLRSDDYPA